MAQLPTNWRCAFSTIVLVWCGLTVITPHTTATSTVIHSFSSQMLFSSHSFAVLELYELYGLAVRVHVVAVLGALSWREIKKPFSLHALVLAPSELEWPHAPVDDSFSSGGEESPIIPIDRASNPTSDTKFVVEISSKWVRNNENMGCCLN